MHKRPGHRRTSGLSFFLPVVHQGNQNSSHEEAEAIGELVAEILGSRTGYRVDCQSVCTIVQVDGVDDLVFVRVFLPYDDQYPGFAGRIDARQSRIERHRVGRLANRHSGDDAMLIQIENCQHRSSVASDEQAPVDLVDRHSSRCVAALQRPTLDHDSSGDVYRHYGIERYFGVTAAEATQETALGNPMSVYTPGSGLGTVGLTGPVCMPSLITGVS